MQTTNHPLIPLPILTNHTPPTSSPYQSLALHVNVGPDPTLSQTPLDHTQEKPFPPSILSTLIVAHD
jgi:hypothetical protein